MMSAVYNPARTHNIQTIQPLTGLLLRFIYRFLNLDRIDLKGQSFCLITTNYDEEPYPVLQKHHRTTVTGALGTRTCVPLPYPHFPW